MLQPVKFKRGSDLEDGETQVLVTNTQLKITTTWPWEKFCDRLEELRNLYLDQV